MKSNTFTSRFLKRGVLFSKGWAFFKRKTSGQVTVFSAVVMLAVVILAGLLVDMARISVGRNIVNKAVSSAARSLLADYSSKLKEEYGIFALSGAEEHKLAERFEEYLASNLSIRTEDFPAGNADLFGFRIENVRVTPVYNLSENQVTKRQILEYMKYRAPKEMLENFLLKLAAVDEVGKMAGAYRQKVRIDKLLGSMDKSQQKLKKLVDGPLAGETAERAEKFINGFNRNGSWEAAYNSYNETVEAIRSMKTGLDSLNRAIDELERHAGIGGADAEGNVGDTESDTESRLESMKAERAILQDRILNAQNELRLLWNEIRYSLTGDYIGVNENAAKEIEKIVEKGREAVEAISELERYLGTVFGEVNSLGDDGGNFSAGFGDQLKSELDKLKALILEGSKAEEIMEDVMANIILLKNITGLLDQAAPGGAQESFLPAELPVLIRNYSNIIYDYIRPDRSAENKDDPRKGKADAVREFIFKKALDDVNYETAGIKKEDLPSYTKVITKISGEEDLNSERQMEMIDDHGVVIDNEVFYKGEFDRIDKEMELYNEDGMFQENALGLVENIGEIAACGLTQLMENIYINEYIMGTFKNSVPELISGGETVKDKNLHGIEKSLYETFYDSEVEYILHGQPSQLLNNIMTKGELLIVRFGLNTLHVYADAQKRAAATGIATAVAGWWTGGAGIPAISNLIMSAWGMGEALLDVSDLMEGKSVPIFKMKGDWKLDIGLAYETSPKTDSRLHFTYHDYLRLFLLTRSENKKLDRIEDLIQLNIGKSKNGFKMSESYTYVQVEAEVSMKFLFITRPFIRKNFKTGDGRYVFKVSAYEGY